MSNAKRNTLALIGPLLFLCSCFFIPESVFGSRAANAAVGTVLWMAFWWIVGAVDYAVTAFLPIAVNAVFQIADMSSVIANYASETILLLLGASLLTSSWDETGLDRWIATKFLAVVGSKLRHQIVFWFILCALLSSVLPNAVICAAMTPIAVSMLKFIGEGDIAKSRAGSLLLLTIAYGTGVGGLASPLGGAMNLVTVEYLEQITGEEYLYFAWVVRFLPIMIVLLVSNIAILLIGCKKEEELGGSKEYFKEQARKMPKLSKEAKVTFFLFLAATALSFARQMYQRYLPGMKPAYVFITCGILSFFVTKKDGTRLMSWKSTQKRIVWDLMYVFAGGLALGTLINESGAAAAIGEMVAAANISNDFALVFAIVLFTLLLSDVTSNTATAAVAMPIVVSVVNGLGKNPIPYVYIASIGVNLSYMLPTSIRAIPVGYGLEPRYMLKKGSLMTIAVIILMSVTGYALMKLWPAFSTV